MSIPMRPRMTAGGYVGPVRKPSEVRGFMVHVAEGVNVAEYLSRKPARNVSVHFTVESDGSIVPMVPELRIAGSLNPAALRTDTGPYYGRRHLDYVLGAAGSKNPNHYVIAVEVAGTAKKGPNAKQVAALVRLFNDCRRRYPNIKPLGHRDQQDLKPCPGGTAAMRLAFSGMGGHGMDYRKPTKPKPPPVVVPPPVTPCDARLADALDHIDDLQDQVDALTAIIDAAKAVLDKAPEEDA